MPWAGNSVKLDHLHDPESPLLPQEAPRHIDIPRVNRVTQLPGAIYLLIASHRLDLKHVTVFKVERPILRVSNVGLGRGPRAAGAAGFHVEGDHILRLLAHSDCCEAIGAERWAAEVVRPDTGFG